MSGATIPGRRIPDRVDGSLEGVEPGDYYRNHQGTWEAAIPNPIWPTTLPQYHHGLCLAGLGNHDVVEHEDGTITVSPSILVWTEWGPNRVRHEYWHGWLERGFWRQA